MSLKRTKIVATVGPSSSERATLADMATAGADVFRLNFSHGTTEDHVAAGRRVRAVAEQSGRNLALLQDVQGPKIRIGTFREGVVEVVAGRRFDLVPGERAGDETGVSISYEKFPGDVEVGQVVLIDDGQVRLRVTGVETGVVSTEVEVGGRLADRKGVNAPGLDPSLPALTDKDIGDLELGVELGVDWVALSFVRRAADLELARHYLERFGSEARLMAKIETPLAIERFDEILEAADGIMVARGDLGVEMAPEEVPVIQKRLIGAAHVAGKPVITATQMLESMVEHTRPTRAETSDVANAIFDGTDAVMLSAETASGRYPVESVAMMQRVATVVEESPEFEARRRTLRPEPARTTPGAIAKAACEVAETLTARAIVVFSAGGSSALRIARNRPRIPVLALTPSPKVRAALALTFGLRTELAPMVTDADDMVRMARERLRTHAMADPGDCIVITAGVPFGAAGTTNLVWVETV